MHQYVRCLDGQRDLVRLQQAGEPELIAEPGFLDLPVVMFGQLAVAHKQPDDIGVPPGQCPGRFNDVVMPLEHEQPCHSHQYHSVFRDAVFFAKGLLFLCRDVPHKGLFVNGRIGRGIGCVQANTHGLGLGGHGIGHRDIVIRPSGGPAFQAYVEFVEACVLIGVE